VVVLAVARPARAPVPVERLVEEDLSPCVQEIGERITGRRDALGADGRRQEAAESPAEEIARRRPPDRRAPSIEERRLEERRRTEERTRVSGELALPRDDDGVQREVLEIVRIEPRTERGPARRGLERPGADQAVAGLRRRAAPFAVDVVDEPHVERLG